MSEKYAIPIQSGLTYHILNMGNNRENLFIEERNYAYFQRKYRQYIAPVADTFAWCLMPNHFHLLVRFKDYDALHKAFPKRFAAPPPGIRHREQLQTVEHSEFDKKISRGLSLQFADFFAGYARAINKAYQRSGKLFSLSFERILVDNETYFEWLLAYIHRNPVHHHFCKDFGEWPHSSYRDIAEALKADRPVSTLSANRSALTIPCDLVFLQNWFAGYEHFAQLHAASIQDMLDKRFWLE